MGNPTLYVDKELMKQIQQGDSMLLQVPEGPGVNEQGQRDEPNYRAKWLEKFSIVGCTVKPAKNNPGMTVVGVECQVLPESESINAGERRYYNFTITHDAIRDKKHDLHDMTKRAMRDLRSLMLAVGIEFEDGDDLFAAFVADEDEGAARVVGREFIGRVSHYWSTKKSEFQQNIDKFAAMPGGS